MMKAPLEILTQHHKDRCTADFFWIEKYLKKMNINCVVSVFGLLSLLSLVLGEITRQEWNAKEPANPLTPLELPVGRVIIAHTARNTCDSQTACSEEVRTIQNFQMETSHFDDIAYNYLVGNDGNIYEGRGSRYQGAVAKNYNAGSLGIAFMGNFIEQLPSETALEAAKALFEKLVSSNILKSDYKIYGHSQLSPTVSPGDALLAEIQKWPNWSEQI